MLDVLLGISRRPPVAAARLLGYCVQASIAEDEERLPLPAGILSGSQQYEREFAELVMRAGAVGAGGSSTC